MNPQYRSTFTYTAALILACSIILVKSKAQEINEWKSSDKMTSEELLEKEGDMDNLNVAIIFSKSGNIKGKIEKTGKNRYITLVKVLDQAYSKFEKALSNSLKEIVKPDNSKDSHEEAQEKNPNPFETIVHELK